MSRSFAILWLAVGVFYAACDEAPPCEVDADCPEGVCTAGRCVPTTCGDGVQNGDETAVDCGGSCGACVGEPCTIDTACASNACAGVVCVPTACGGEPCQHGGTCFDAAGGGYRCDCAAGWSGDDCAVSDGCFASPCGAGTCADDGAGGYDCSCPTGHYDDGSTCAACEAVADCDAVTCTAATDAACVACRDGFAGDGAGGCADVDDCVGAPCGAGTCADAGAHAYTCACPAGSYDDGATCAACAPRTGCESVTCTSATDAVCGACAEGYQPNGSGGCQDADGCAAAPCGDGTCLDGAGPGRPYACECPAGQFDDGTTCAACGLPVGCAAATCGSATDAACTACDAGYEADGASGCRDRDDCAGAPCGDGVCTDAGANAYHCLCDAGFYADGTTCAACGAVAGCDAVVCTTATDAACATCAAGFEGDGAGGCRDVDDCATTPCGSGTCQDTGTDSYACSCPAGTYDDGATCVMCAAIADCDAVACTGAMNASCATCAAGFEDNGAGGCRDHEDCAPNPCGAGTCTDAGANAYDCACPAGAYDDGTTCASCPGLVGCDAVSCTSSADATCTACADGYEPSGAGGCQDIDGCAAAPCGDGTCSDGLPYYSCACPAGAFFDGTTCATCAPIGDCAAVTCASGTDAVCATCADGFAPAAGGCANIDDCAGHTCGAGTCVDGVLGYTCDCPDGTYGDATTACAPCAAIDHCVTATCAAADDATCVSCQAGYGVVGGACVNVDDCVGNTCGAGTCVDGVESYSCDCPDGAWGDGTTACTACMEVANCVSMACTTASDATCTACVGGYANNGAGGCQNVDDCAGNACGAGTCVDGVEGYSCDCPDGAWGDGTTACTACARPADCEAATCTSANDATCATCAAGFALDGGACANVDDCGAATCGAGTCVDGLLGYTCDCPEGTWGDGTTTCTACALPANCAVATCSAANDASCSACLEGYELAGADCVASGPPDLTLDRVEVALELAAGSPGLLAGDVLDAGDGAFAQVLTALASEPGGTAGQVFAHAGPVTGATAYTAPKLPAASLRAIVRTPDVWRDARDISVSAQIRDALGQSQAAATVVTLSAEVGGEAALTATCTTGTDGTCDGTLTLPASWFGANDAEVRVTTRTAALATAAEVVTLHAYHAPALPTAGAALVLPLGPRRAGTSFTVPVTAYTGSSPLGAFDLSVSFDPALFEVVSVTLAASLADGVSNVLDGGVVKLVGVAAAGTYGPFELARVTFRVKATASVGAEGALAGTVVDLLDPQNAPLVASGAALSGARTVAVAANPVRGLVATAARAQLFDQRALTGATVSSAIRVRAVRTALPDEDVSAGAACAGAPGCVFAPGAADGPVTVAVSHAGYAVDVPLTVWKPALPLEVTVSNATLARVGGWLAADCVGARYERAAVTVEATFAAGDQTVSGRVAPALAVEGAATVALIEGRLVGTAPGTTAVLAVGPSGAELGRVSVSVTDAPVAVLGLDVVVLTELAFDAVPPGADGDPLGPRDVTVRARQVLEAEGATGAVLAWARLSDGTREAVDAALGLTLATRDPALLAVTSDPAQVTTLAAGQGELVAATWEVCGATVAEGLGAVVLNLPDPSGGFVTLAAPRVAVGPVDPAALAGVPSETGVAVRLDYENGTSADFTLDPRTQYDDASGDPSDLFVVVVGDGEVSVVPTGHGVGTATLNMTFAHAAVTLTATVNIVRHESFAFAARPWPTYPGSTSFNEVVLSPLEGTGVYQAASLELVSVLTDGFRVDVSTLGATHYAVEGGTVEVTGANRVHALAPGTATVVGSLGGASSAGLTIEVAATPVAATVVTTSFPSTFAGVVGASAQLTAKATFSDGTEQLAAHLIPGLLSFTSSDETRVSIAEATGLATLHANHNRLVTLTAVASDASGASQTAANLLASVGDVDLGETTGVAYPDRGPGEVFVMPLRVNTGGRSFGALDVTLAFDPQVVTVLAVEPGASWPGGQLDSNINNVTGRVQVVAAASATATAAGSALHVVNLRFVASSAVGKPETLMSGVITKFLDNTLDLAPIGEALEAGETRAIVAGHGLLDPTCGAFEPEDFRGNANGNCEFEVGDVSFTLQYLASLVTDGQLLAFQRVELDSDADTKITVADAVYKLRVLVGKFAFADFAFTDAQALHDALTFEARLIDKTEAPVAADAVVYFEVGTTQNMTVTQGTLEASTATSRVLRAVHVGGGVYRAATTGFAHAEAGIGVVPIVRTFDAVGATADDRVAAFSGTPWVNALMTFAPLATVEVVDFPCFGALPGQCCVPSTGARAAIDDGNPCTADHCDVATGTVSHADLSEAGKCCDPSDGSQAVLDDGNPCTLDTCDIATGPNHPADAGAPCDDALTTTYADTCDAAGACVGTPVTTCDAAQYETASPTATTDRVCSALSVCTAAQYESTAATATTDRGCSDLTVCTAAQYESTAATTTSDRACSDLTVCTAAQYESTAATATSDRACSDLTVCTAAQFESTAATTTGDRACTDLTTCSATEFESTAATATSDRACTDPTTCSATEFESTAATATSDRVCTALTVCTATQYESIAATATSDRTCTALTVCTAAQFESAAATGTSDRACTALTVCTEAQYESTSATATSDRACSDLTVCTAAQYESTAATATADRVCSALTECTAAEFESTAATATSDRVCTALTVCTATQFESTAATATSDRSCTDLTTCTAAQYESTAATTTSDRVCTALTVCTATQFESTAATTTSDRSCTDLTTCTAAQYESTAPTSTSDRACTDLTTCSANEFESTAATATSDRVCTALTVCTATQYESTAPTSTSDRACADLTTCTAAQYESTAATATTDRACTALTECTAAQYESTAPTATSDRICTALTECTAAQYESTAATATTDRGCSDLTVCTAAQYESQAATATTDRGCSDLTVCTAAQYESQAATATTDRACSDLTICTAAQYESTAATATTDRECTPCTAMASCDAVTCTSDSDSVCTTCSAGFWGGGATCSPWSTCAGDQYELAPPTATTDRTCAACAAIADCDAVACTAANDAHCTACATGFEVEAGACADLDACAAAPCDPHATCTDLPAPALDNASGRTCACAATHEGTGEIGGCEPIVACPTLSAKLLITGVISGALTGALPKAIAVYVVEDIADLSVFGLGSANNGEGTDGREFTFPAVSAAAGSTLTIASNAAGFTGFFGVDPSYVHSAAIINGDDAIELFEEVAGTWTVIDTFGDITHAGGALPWLYERGWASRRNRTDAADGDFVASDWIYSGSDALAACTTTNADCAVPFPLGTFIKGTPPCGDGTCSDAGDGTYSCTCPAGQYDDDVTCADIDACAANGCGANATCTDLVAPAPDDGTGRTCACNTGFEGDAEAGCTDIDACATNPCGANATCTDLVAPALGDTTGRTCACNTGFEGDADTGCTDIDACDAHACGANATCTDLVAPAIGDAAGRTCACDAGFEGDAIAGCTDIDACLHSVCGANATCSDLPAAPDDATGRDCTCVPGYVGQASGPYVAPAYPGCIQLHVLTVVPGEVPDEQEPRPVSDAPEGFGPTSWRGPAVGKTNWRARYRADGDALSALFPTQAATLKVSDLRSIRYATKRPADQAGRDWSIQITTRPMGPGMGDASTAYHARFTNNYADHTAVDAWTPYSTESGMTFSTDEGLDDLDLGELVDGWGDELIESISVQTDGAWDGALDGLEIVLTSGQVGRVDFTAGTYLTVVPNEVPDEETPRVVASAPPGYGATSWQGPDNGKSNWHAWYDEAGFGTLSALFPEDADALDLGAIAKIAYSTHRPTGAVGQDWWISLYTRPAVGDTGWYHARYLSNFDTHTVEDAWVRYATDGPSGDVPAMTFRAQDAGGNPIGPAMTLAELFAQDAQPVLALTVQTASAWDGFDGLVDGLEVTLVNGHVGKVNFVDGTVLPVAPHQVPDEQLPRVNLIDAPAPFGPSSWQGPATGKSNWHARYLADGDALTALFPTEAADLRVQDLASISYATKRPDLADQAGRDWWIQVYTRPQAGDTGWYHARYINDYASHTAVDSWTRYSTRTGMTFDGLTFTAFVAAHKDDLVEMISLQTNSAWNGFDGSVDGLEIVLTDGRVGRVNLVGCAPGDYPVGNACAACDAVADCDGGVTCTDAGASACGTCAASFEPDGQGGCRCPSGLYDDGASCVSCPSVALCTGQVTCTSLTDVLCDACARGYGFDAATDACVDVDWCATAGAAACGANATCADAGGPNTCACAPGFNGDPYGHDGYGGCIAATMLHVAPGEVPDEQQSRVHTADAPVGYGPTAWQGPVSGKSNWHARYLADGDGLSALFPTEAATLTVADLATLSYWTKRPVGGLANRDWWVSIYTRPQAGDSGWYHARLTNNYATHAEEGVWTRYSTGTGMTFGGLTLAELIAARGAELIEMISVQTDSGWDGFDGAVDGLEIALTNGAVGRVNFGGATTLLVAPTEVPDEREPRTFVHVAPDAAPPSYGPVSWQAPAVGKTNWCAATWPDGSGALADLFPDQADDLTVADLASISYATRRPNDAGQRDWWVTIYTRPEAGDTGWYHARYINNFAAHTVVDRWQRYTTGAATGDVPAMTFARLDASNQPLAPAMTLPELIAAVGNERVLAVSVQTASDWTDFGGLLDGLEIVLASGEVGRVDFGAVRTLRALPGDVPDEQEPRANPGDAPTGFGPSSWRGPASGKTNWYAFYLPDGSGTLSALFPAEAPTLTVSDLALLRYATKRPTGGVLGRDWWVTIYTRKQGEAGEGAWYGRRFINNFDDHDVEGAWTRYGTDFGTGDVVPMTFQEYSPAGAFVGDALTLSALGAGDYGDDEVLAISVHTDSAWDGFDGALDGLEIGLHSGAVGHVDFTEGEVLRVVPADVPDEQYPRVNAADAPAGFGPSSWQGPAAGAAHKTNWHAFYLPDGSGTLSALFPQQAATLRVSDLASIRYATKRPAGTPSGADWWVTIYTRLQATGNAGSWYHQRYHSNYGAHTAVDAWTDYATDAWTGDLAPMTFDATGDTLPALPLDQLGAALPGDEVLAITVQTNSGWNGFDAALDGLEVTLRDGAVGRVDFGAGERLRALPGEVPDEQPARATADAPPGYGPGAWQGPAAGKTNWHAWYEANGSGTLSALFPDVAPSLTVAHLASLAYWTKRPVGQAGRDWWVTIYTRPDAADGRWYHARYLSNFDAHTVEGAWVRYTTRAASGAVPAMTFRAQEASGAPVGPAMTLAQLAAQDGRAILAVTVQTASDWGGFDGLVDGLEIVLTDGRAGKVDFSVGERIALRPSVVPDEAWPRSNPKDAPPNYGAGQGSWVGPAAGKTNLHIGYDASQDIGPLEDLFGAQAATLTISDLASISYFTKRPADFVDAGQDWWVTIYTRATGSDDESWYHRRYVSNYADHSAIDAWTRYSTAFASGAVPAMTFRQQLPDNSPTGAAMSLSALAATLVAADERLLSITLQTDSGWAGFDGSVDGLEIALADGRVGRVDLQRCDAASCNSIARAGLRLTSVQCTSGTWGWPLSEGCPAGYGNLIAPTAQGLASAYAATTPADTAMRDALVRAGDYLLAKTNTFSIADGYLAVTLDEVLSPTERVYSAHVKAAFYDALLMGTYQRAGSATPYTTQAYLDLKRQERVTQGIPNLATWDLGMALYGAQRMKDHVPGFLMAVAWRDAAEGELEELTQGWYDVIGLAGAIIGLAHARLDFTPTAGMHAGADGIAGLVADLLSYQLPDNGAFTWESDALAASDAVTQETAYALLALVEARDFGVTGLDDAIDDAALWLIATQVDAGGWLDATGGTEYAEVDAEAVWALVRAGYY